MAELFMECEEEELEPWQQKSKPIIVDDDDDDDEPIFVGEILSSKPANTYILNRVNPSSPRVAVQNGTPKRGFQPMARPAASTLAVQPQPRSGSLSGTSAGLQTPLPGSSSPPEAAKPSVGRSAPTPSLSRNLNIQAMAQSPARPVATVTAQPVALNRVPPSNPSGLVFGLRQSPGTPQCSGSAVETATGLSKRPAPSELSSVSPKKAKAEETGSGSSPPVSSSVKSPNEMSSLPKGMASGSAKNGAPFPQACPKCNIHFNLLDPLRNHMKYCCPDLVHTFLGASSADSSATSAKMAESEKGKLIMLVNDFYYGKYEGNVQQVNQEQKTHTTFKCASCMKLLKNNIRFMNHMKHHLELEKQNSESWESHTTCQHCYRQFPTPFQLQCHIESTHTPYESSTICRICELSFETEQILLQHMKDNHKPGEMPYVCQVCNYRSSAFPDVEKHFRAVHENTKNLLCPFCLKVIKIGAPYMHHYMRHQKKGVHRCTKCRLQFLTCKEKMDHKSQHHRTFRKPAQLEGLPPGTKVTIRASLGSLPPAAATTPLVGTSTSTLQLSPNVKMANPKNYTKLNVSKAKPKLKPLSVQKRQSLGISSLGSGGSSSGGSKKNNKIANTALSSLRCSEIQKCIECSSDIRTFASHFPAYVHCSLCRYATSCSKAYVNHMVSFHSARQSKRFWIYKAHSEELRGMTTVCLNCDFVMDDSGLDKMATHLNESWSHRCRVIVENVSSENVATEVLSDRTNDTPLSNEGEDRSQDLPSPSPPEGQGGTSATASSETENCAEETDKDQPGQGDETSSADKREEKASHPNQDNSSSPALSAPSEDPPEEGRQGSPGDHLTEGYATAVNEAEEEVASPSVIGPSSGLGGQTVSEDDPTESGETDQSGNQLAEGVVAAEGGENSPPECSGPGFSDCPEDPREAPEEASLTDRLAEGAVAAEGGENSPPPVPECSSSPGLAAHPKDRQVSAGDGTAGSPENPVAESSRVDECEGKASVVGQPSGLTLSPCSEDLEASAEETRGFGSQMEEGCAAAPFREDVASSTLEPSSSSGLSACSKDSSQTAEETQGDVPKTEAEETSVAAAPLVAGSLDTRAQAPLKASAESVAKDSPGKQAAAPCEGSSSAPSAGESAGPGVQPCLGETSCHKAAGCDNSPTGDHAGERISPKPTGEETCPGSGDQQQGSDLEEAEFEEVDADSSRQASDGDVSFEQFLRRRDEPESVSSDVSEQGSVHLEPLTPSEVLEHEATEILQKGGSVPSSAKASGPGSEPAEAVASREGSPAHGEAAASQAEESKEAS